MAHCGFAFVLQARFLQRLVGVVPERLAGGKLLLAFLGIEPACGTGGHDILAGQVLLASAKLRAFIT